MKGIVGFVLSLIALLLTCNSPMVSLWLAIISIILCAIGISNKKHRILSIIGIVIGVIAFIISLISYGANTYNKTDTSNKIQENEYSENANIESSDNATLETEYTMSEIDLDTIYMLPDSYVGEKIAVEIVADLETITSDDNSEIYIVGYRNSNDFTVVKYTDNSFSCSAGDTLKITGTVVGKFDETEDYPCGLAIEADTIEIIQQNLGTSNVPIDESSETQTAVTKDEFIASCQEYNYKDVLRNPEDYIGKRIKVTVKISSVHSESWLNDGKYYFAYSNDEYDWWMGDEYGIFDRRTEQNPKLLEDDIITVYGEIIQLILLVRFPNILRQQQIFLLDMPIINHLQIYLFSY